MTAVITDDLKLNISKIEEVIIGIKASFDTSETIILSIESKAFHEWVITLMDELQSAGFQNLQIKTYTDQL